MIIVKQIHASKYRLNCHRQSPTSEAVTAKVTTIFILQNVYEEFVFLGIKSFKTLKYLILRTSSLSTNKEATK